MLRVHLVLSRPNSSLPPRPFEGSWAARCPDPSSITCLLPGRIITLLRSLLGALAPQSETSLEGGRGPRSPACCAGRCCVSVSVCISNCTKLGFMLFGLPCCSVSAVPTPPFPLTARALVPWHRSRAHLGRPALCLLSISFPARVARVPF